MLRLSGLVLTTLAATSLAAGVLAIYSRPLPDQCELTDPATLRIVGPVDSEMADCAKRLLTENVETVIVTSPGGETFAGRRVGHAIGAHDRTLVVRGFCASSCGNYFVPAARRVILEPGSRIALHGSPDPRLAAISRSRFERSQADRLERGEITQLSWELSREHFDRRQAEEFREEAEFAAQFHVPPGWLLHRDAGDEAADYMRHMTGALPDDARGMLFVEEAFLASCLPHVDAPNFQAAYDAAEPRIALRRNAPLLIGFSSGDLQCWQVS